MQTRLTALLFAGIFFSFSACADAEGFTFKPGGLLMFDVADYSEGVSDVTLIAAKQDVDY